MSKRFVAGLLLASACLFSATAHSGEVTTPSIETFRGKLAALQNGQRQAPVVVLHIGDSHIAMDSFTKGIRSRLQQRFGDAGRGAVIPADAFDQTIATGVQLSSRGQWNAAMSLHDGDGIYGVSGVRVNSASPNAVMKLEADNPFDQASVTMVTGPRQGSFTVKVGDVAQTFSAKANETGARTFDLPAGKSIEISPKGDGDVAVLDWSTTQNRPGLRYINFGQVGSTVRVTKRWNDAAVINDLAAIKPDLIVYGFGTNEGFDDNTDLPTYRATAAKFLNLLKSAAPDAGFVIIGAADSLRRGSGQSCGGGLSSPPKLAAIRNTMKFVANEMGAFYWDWSQAMGGPCSVADWTRRGLAAPDHVHLTPKGYDLSAEKFTAALLGPLMEVPQSTASTQ